MNRKTTVASLIALFLSISVMALASQKGNDNQTINIKGMIILGPEIY